LELSNNNGELTLRAEKYSLYFPSDRPFVSLLTSQGERIAELFIFAGVHPMNGRDETYQVDRWQADEQADQIHLSISAKSTAWTAKTYHFYCKPERFTYSIEIEGTGDFAEVEYFGGYYSGGNKRWGTGFFWSGQNFVQLFNPEPNIPEVFHHSPAGGSKIDLTGVPIPAKGDWFFTPPPFCFAAQYTDGWLALGVEAEAGKNTFTEYHYRGMYRAFHLSLSYEGHTRVDGQYSLPAIGFDFAADEYDALTAHVTSLQTAGLVPLSQTKESPDWWRSPIFCGWGAQCYLSTLDKGHTPNYARQENYVGFLKALAENGLNPGIVVLDDKWQAAYGDNTVDEDKWPDLRGFIDGQHAQGRHVLLWLKAWDSEGVPVDECVTNAAGVPMAFDPTNPAFEKRLRAAVRRMLSSDSYDADGFKLDFTARIPSGPGLHAYDDSVWGLEMMRRYLEILYSEAKQIKPDALIMTHTPHSYLADVLDMIRLNDINMGTDVNRAMTHRARVASIACPEAIIDTDNWPIADKATWARYMEIQADLGVPSLYYATHIDVTQEPLTAQDYALIRQVWDKAALAKPRRKTVGSIHI
jgi:hypothetical protein